MKKGAACMMVVILIVVSLVGMVYAVEKTPAKGPLPKAAIQVNTADIEIWGAILPQCVCKKVCDIMDAIAITFKPSIAIHNNGPATTEVTITATVFNYLSNSEVTYTDKIEIKAKQSTNYYMEVMAASPSSPVVVKKSYGVKIKVVPSTPGITDPKLSNNTKTLKSCQTYN